MSYTMQPHEVSADIDAATIDRRRQKQPRDGGYPALVAEPATPENLEALAWTPEDAERLRIKQVLVPACPLCRRHAAGDKAVGARYYTKGRWVHSVVAGPSGLQRPCWKGE